MPNKLVRTIVEIDDGSLMNDETKVIHDDVSSLSDDQIQDMIRVDINGLLYDYYRSMGEDLANHEEARKMAEDNEYLWKTCDEQRKKEWVHTHDYSCSMTFGYLIA